MVTTSRARPMVEDSGDYSDDFSLGANSPPAEGDERAPASAAASAAAATLAASAAAARQGDMRASEVGFAGVRFGGGEEEEDETGALVVAAAAASPLLSECSAERQEYCPKVRVHRHDGRLMRCLAARAGGGGFSDRCRAALAARVHGRQVDWRLDPRLAKACDADAARLCGGGGGSEGAEAEAEEAAAAAESGEEDQEEATTRGAAAPPALSGSKQLRCLARHASSSGLAAAGVLSSQCEDELSRAAHSFLFLWAPRGPLTAPCDNDVQRLCLVADELLAQTPGAVDACLVGVHRRQQQHAAAENDASWRRDDRKLAPRCAALVRLSDSGRERALKREFSASLALYAAMHTSVEALEHALGGGVPLARRDAGGAKIEALTPAGVGAAVGGSIAGALVLGGIVAAVVVCCVRASRARRKRRGLMAGAGVAPSVRGERAAAVFLKMPPPATPVQGGAAL